MTRDPRAPDERYAELIAREARHWGASDHDPENPQLWDDPVLFERTLARAYRHLVTRAVSGHQTGLELGCGDGDLTLDLAAGGLTMTGIDLAPERITRARAAADARGVAGRVRFQVGDLNTMALPEGAFDVVVAHDALHHILALGALLDRVHRALVPGGTLIVSDYAGVGSVEKFLNALAYALLPTRQPYASKWRLRRRMAAFMASERAKREALARGRDDAAIHDASPFEGITQTSIEPEVRARFEILERFTFCPYWYHLVPKVRMPGTWQRGLLGAMHGFDATLHRRGWTRGSYCFIEAKRRD